MLRGDWKVTNKKVKQSFFEFYELIGDYPYEDAANKFNDKYDAIVASNDFDKFVDYFDDHSGYAPTIFPYFEPMYITNCKNLLVYQGSYKYVVKKRRLPV
jgi:hypothetical protein